MPLYCEKTNVNGITYTRDVYEKAIQHGCDEISLMAYDKNGNRVVIGSGALSLMDDKLIFDGFAWSARFDRYAYTTDKGSTISDMEIVSVEFDSDYTKGRKLTNTQFSILCNPDVNIDKKAFEDAVKPFLNNSDD